MSTLAEKMVNFVAARNARIASQVTEQASINAFFNAADANDKTIPVGRYVKEPDGDTIFGNVEGKAVTLFPAE